LLNDADSWTKIKIIEAFTEYGKKYENLDFKGIIFKLKPLAEQEDKAIREVLIKNLPYLACYGYPNESSGLGLSDEAYDIWEQQYPLVKEILPILIGGLSDEDSDIIIQATIALKDLSPLSRDGVGDLIKLLDNKDENIRIHAVAALDSIPGVPSSINPMLIKIIREKGEDVWMALNLIIRTYGQTVEMEEVLIEALNYEDVKIKWKVLQTLSYISPKSKDMIKEIVPLLEDDTPLGTPFMGCEMRMRNVAIDALGSFKQDAIDVGPKLLELLKNGNSADRVLSAIGLGKIGPSDEIIGGLSSALKDDFYYVRIFAAQSLGCFGNKAEVAIKNLEALLNDENLDVRETARQAIMRIKGELPILGT
jgi:HEAT repeat protein